MRGGGGVGGTGWKEGVRGLEEQDGRRVCGGGGGGLEEQDGSIDKEGGGGLEEQDGRRVWGGWRNRMEGGCAGGGGWRNRMEV